MEMMGYIAALFIGISLGLIGGGGSILTVPVLVYLFGISPLVATSYSLFVVGSTSLVGALDYFNKKLIDFRTGILFGISSIITVFVTRKLIIPVIPEHFKVVGYWVSFSVLTMVLFAVLMLMASFSMIRSKEVNAQKNIKNSNTGFLLIYGVGIGLITGFFGAGGGFLLIPALVLLLQLPMKKAIGTSLLIISFNSLVGFAGDAGHFQIDWTLLLTVTAIAMAGVIAGSFLGKKIQSDNLRKGFGWFVLLMGIYILLRELF